MTKKIKYKRILLKISGEVLAGDTGKLFDPDIIFNISKQIKEVQKMGVSVGIVIGGGNIWRFRDFKNLKFLNRTKSDTLGMTATLMNSVVFSEALNSIGAKSVVYSAIPSVKMAKDYIIEKAGEDFDDGKIVLFAGGTGSPFFTTDSAAALRALEMKCDVLMKATKVDYVYDKDPMKFKNAKKFEKMSYEDIIKNELGVMDLTCASMLSGSGIPMLVFNLNKNGNIKKAVVGEKVGTIIT